MNQEQIDVLNRIRNYSGYFPGELANKLANMITEAEAQSRDVETVIDFVVRGTFRKHVRLRADVIVEADSLDDSETKVWQNKHVHTYEEDTDECSIPDDCTEEVTNGTE